MLERANGNASRDADGARTANRDRERTGKGSALSWPLWWATSGAATGIEADSAAAGARERT